MVCQPDATASVALFIPQRRSAMPMFFFTTSLGCLLLWLSLVFFAAACKKDQPRPTERIRAIKTITIAERAGGIPRKFPGIIEAVETSALSFEVSGNIQELRVDVGDRVQKGQVLALLDKRDFRLNVESAQAELTREQAFRTQRKKDLERLQNIFTEDPGATSQAALDEAQATYESARSTVSYAASKLNLAQSDLEKTELVAPFHGSIAEKYVEAFQAVSRGEKIFDLFAEGAMEVAISVPETVIEYVTLGLPGAVRLPTEPAQVYDGSVSEVSAAADTANAFPAKVLIRNGNGRILPGMTAEVTLLIPLRNETAAYLVPVQAVTAGADSTRGYVFLFDPATSLVKKRAVRVVGFRENDMMLSAGVQAGDMVAIAGVSFLEDGQKVKLLTQPE